MTSSNIGTDYRPAGVPTSRMRDTVERLVAHFDWAVPEYLADGSAIVSVLDYRGIVERQITVFFDGGTATTGSLLHD